MFSCTTLLIALIIYNLYLWITLKKYFNYFKNYLILANLLSIDIYFKYVNIKSR